MAKRRTIPERAEAAFTTFSGSGGVEGKSIAEKPVRGVKSSVDRITVDIASDVADMARNAAYWTHGTLAKLVEEGIRREVERLESERGEEFAARPEELKRGRPLR